LSGDFKEFAKQTKIEEVSSMIDEEFLKSKGKETRKEYVLANPPSQVIKEVLSYHIDKSGITEKNVGNIKKEDSVQVKKVDEVEG